MKYITGLLAMMSIGHHVTLYLQVNEYPYYLSLFLVIYAQAIFASALLTIKFLEATNNEARTAAAQEVIGVLFWPIVIPLGIVGMYLGE